MLNIREVGEHIEPDIVCYDISTTEYNKEKFKIR